MNPENLKAWFADALPFRTKSALDWILPLSIGLGVGVAAGIGLGMLTAKEDGEHLRRRLRRGAQELTQDLKEKAAKLADRAKGQAERARGELEGNAPTYDSSEAR